ncbi:MAG: phage tail tape measure protein [Cyanobacteria bacterium P01_D01_bin.36]
MSIASLQIQIEALDRATGGIRKIAGEIEKLEKFSNNASEVGERLTSVGENLKTRVTAPISAGLELAAKTAIDFEAGLAGAAKTLGTTEAQTKALGNELLSMTRTLPMSATELTEIAAAGGQLGIVAEDISGFVDVTAKMGTAFDMSAGMAGDAIASLMNVYSLNLDGVTGMGDAINAVSNSSAASASAIVAAAAQSGGAARQFGLTETQAVALNGAIIALGRPAEVTATALSSMLPVLQTATGQMPAFQEGLEMAGLSATQLESAIQQDAMGGLTMFIDALGQMEAQQRALAIQSMFGSGSDAQILAQLAADSSGLAKNLELVGNAANFAGSMQAEFEAQSGTTASQLQRTKNAAAEVGVSVGNATLPAITELATSMTPLAQKFAEFAQNNPGIVKIGIAIAGVAAALGPVLIFIGAIASAVGAIIPIVTAIGVAVLGVVSGPILIGIALVAAGAALIIANWGKVKNFFVIVKDKAVELGNAFRNLVSRGVAAFTRLAAGIASSIARIVMRFQVMRVRILATLRGIASRALEAGKQIVQKIAQGILSGISAVVNAAKKVGQAVMSVLPNSPVPTGPLTALNNPATSPGAKIVDMLSAGILSRAGRIGGALGGALSPAASPARLFAGGTQPAQVSSGSSGNSFVINLTVSENMADAAIEQLEQKIDELMGRYNARQERLSYG